MTETATREQEAVEKQLESRSQLKSFLDRVSGPVRKFGEKVKSEWFGRPDEELKGWIQRGDAIAEIRETLGYRMIMEQTEREIEWAREQLEIGKLDAVEIRMYLRSLRFLKEFILTTERNADIASSVLAQREGSIGRQSFVKPATVGERY